MQSIQTLLIEDNQDDARIVSRFLHKHHEDQFAIEHVSSVKEADKALAQRSFDIILTDLQLPDSQGMDTIQYLAESYNLPIIALTGMTGKNVELEAIRHGASDYVPKQLVSQGTLPRRMICSLERHQMRMKVEESNQLLARKNRKLAKMYLMSQQFVDNISHEFRTPLTVIREFASVIQDGLDGPVTEQQSTRLGTLINRTDDLARMVDDLLDTSRLEAGLVRVCRREHLMGDIVDQVVTMLEPRAATKDIKLVAGEMDKYQRLFCDDEKLRRVLINLVVNAIKFTPAGGRIEISQVTGPDDQTGIAVKDSGPGIPPKDLERIFRRFQQVSSHHRLASCKGFGLGLSIARDLSGLNLGYLTLDSVEGEGATFTVFVPKAEINSIVDGYLRQRTQEINEGYDISVIGVSADEQCLKACSDEDRKEVLESLDEFLRSHIKNCDLVLRLDHNVWLAYTLNGPISLAGFFDRLDRQWNELRRNSLGVELPDLKTEIHGTMQLPCTREHLVEFAKRLQARESKNKSPEQGASELEVASDGRTRILVVEDEPELAGVVESRLRHNGYLVSVVHDGVACLEAVKAFHPDLILLDLRMPKMDGLTALKQLKSSLATSGIPVIVVSASISEKMDALDRGANYFIQKPYKSDAILAAIDVALASQMASLT